jgi:hypothetical protein
MKLACRKFLHAAVPATSRIATSVARRAMSKPNYREVVMTGTRAGAPRPRRSGGERAVRAVGPFQHIGNL